MRSQDHIQLSYVILPLTTFSRPISATPAAEPITNIEPPAVDMKYATQMKWRTRRMYACMHVCMYVAVKSDLFLHTGRWVATAASPWVYPRADTFPWWPRREERCQWGPMQCRLAWPRYFGLGWIGLSPPQATAIFPQSLTRLCTV